MNVLISLVISLAAVFFGAWLGSKYDGYVSNRQEKAILVLLIQEFSLLIKRTKMYYRQMLGPGVSFSTLFESSDASTFVKFAEVSKNSETIKRALKLKSDFFQVIRHANRASEAAAQSNFLQRISKSEPKQTARTKLENQAAQKMIEAKLAQGTAVTFFMGERKKGDRFGRERCRDYIDNVQYLLDYLEDLNSSSRITEFLIIFMPRIRKEKGSVESFVTSQKESLALIEEILELLIEKEKLLAGA
jgi:hypothetical protein